MTHYKVRYWYEGYNDTFLVEVDCEAENEEGAARWFCDHYQGGDPAYEGRIMDSIEKCEQPMQRVNWSKEGF